MSVRVSEAEAKALLKRRQQGNISPVPRTCATCGKTFTAVWARSKHCPDCGLAARQTAVQRGIDSRKAGKSGAIAEIQATSGRQVTRLTDVLEREPFVWSVFFSVPYSLDASKNRRWSLNGKGSVYLSGSVRAYSEMVIACVRNAMKGQRVAQNKVWLSFFVEKANHRSDAINVVDTLCDAIKVALDVDDRWFCIDRVDWAIKKQDQYIIIKISQTSTDDVIVCSHCGEIKGLESFGRKTTGKLGKTRVCKPCVQVLSRHAKQHRRRAA